ncbi:alpha/beta fold hydrolase [Geodermatophilus sabuli]|uniref:Lysophospholipase, alpha-beta hydrolase superfamily n=1 Tax=Geodermatophilus sabuli TaxID=1564158 RepID=A0A285EDX0_9ACTN|nr:alpha/beta hydrolase [Geodermatophilus sabuli]MBB3084326.1 alpha-beta hydrolase superfamily lysophospholipase [Geodermatophilus sabuli]SNX96404.1 Lysophospholipase, alpha-beta hydrolase superfamily [Geodermatophilus sabuli]
MPPQELEIPSAHDVPVTAYRWDPAGPPRGVVQLTHGMGEHLLRYGPLAAQLTAAGFVVVGQDHRGHGATARDGRWGELGPGGWDELVRDIGRVSDRVRADLPGLPLVLLGHSMGSFAAQQYVLDHGDELAGLVLTGTAALDLLEPALDLDQPLDLSAFNAAFEPARTDYDWLSRDEAQVDAYVADPRCGFGLSREDGRQMFVSARQLADPRRVGGVRADLPVYVAVGDQDPVNGALALVHGLVQRLGDAGLTDVTLRVYEGARHEVFNETNRDEVVADLLGWLDRVVPPTG